MQILLTGATGFVGSQLLKSLIAHGDSVRVLIRPETAKLLKNTKFARESDGVEVIVGDLADVDLLEQASKKVETVYHLAACLPGRDVQRQEIISTNVKGTENLLHASVAAGVRRLVFTSSAMAVYDTTQMHISEDAPLEARGLYGRTKIAAENLIRHYHDIHHLEYVVLRLGPVYGTGARYFEWLLHLILNHPWFVAHHGREEIIHWIHINDVVDALILAGTQPKTASCTFNIAGDEAITRRDLVALVHYIAYGDYLVLPLGAQRVTFGYPLKYDISRAMGLLKFQPKVTLQDGLTKMITDIDHI